MKKLAFSVIGLLALLAPSGSRAQNFWEPVDAPSAPQDCSSIAVDNAGNLFAVSTSWSRFLRSTDDGSTWYNIKSHLPDVLTYGVIADHSGHVFGITDSGLMVTSDEGVNWIKTGSEINIFRSLTVGNDDELYALSGNDTVIVSTDHGKTWIPTDAGLGRFASFSVVGVAPSGDIYIVATNDSVSASSTGEVLQSSDKGKSWVVKDTGMVFFYAQQILCDAHQDIFIVTFDSVVFSNDNGETWKGAQGIGDETWAIALDSLGRVYVAGYSGLYLSKNRGNTWSLRQPDFEQITCVAAKANQIFVGPNADDVYRSANGGNTWNEAGWEPDPGTSFIGSRSDGRFYMSAWPSGIAAYNDSDGTWTYSTQDYLSQGYPFGASVLAASPDGDVFAVTEFNGTFLSKNKGQSWNYNSPARTDIVVDSHGVAYAIDDSGFYRCLVGGSAWIEMSTNSTHIPLEYNSYPGLAVDSTGVIYAGDVHNSSFNGLYSGISVSRDSGKTWQSTELIVDSLIVFSIEIDDSTKALFALTNKGVYRSSGLNNWELVQRHQYNPTSSSIIILSPRHVLISNDSGVLYSTDEGDTWTPLNTGLSGTCSGVTVNLSGRLLAITSQGVFRSVEPRSTVASSKERVADLILQNSPNPFTQSTNISFTLNEPSYITLKLFNPLGIEVASLANGFFDAGEHAITFDRGDLPDGVYFYRLEGGGESVTRSFVIMR